MEPRAGDGRTTVCPLWLLRAGFCGPQRLQTGAIKFLQLQLVHVDAVKAAHVEHDQVSATRTLAISVRLDAAGLAERVNLIVRQPSPVLVRSKYSTYIRLLWKNSLSDRS